MSVAIPGLTAGLALVMAILLLDQWRERRHGFQLVWAVGMACYAVGAGAQALAASSGWTEVLYRAWYLSGAVWTAAWLGLGTAFLLGRTRFGYTYAVLLLFSGLIALMIRNSPDYAGSGPLPVLYLLVAVLLAVAIGVEAYFASPRWTTYAAAGVVGATLLSIALMVATHLPDPGYALDPGTGQPVATLMPGYLRLLTPVLNFTGALSLLLGAVFSTYVFMPKKRLLPYSLDPRQPGDQFLFNLLIAPVAITVNLVASLPATGRALVTGKLHSRVPATILIAIGAFFPTLTDSLERAGATQLFGIGKLLGVLFLLAGFLVSVEVFGDIRVPFAGRRRPVARTERRDIAADGSAGPEQALPEEPAQPPEPAQPGEPAGPARPA